MCAYICVHICVHICARVYTRVRVYVYVHAYVLHVWVHACVHVYVCIHIHLYVHVHTHSYLERNHNQSQWYIKEPQEGAPQALSRNPMCVCPGRGGRGVLPGADVFACLGEPHPAWKADVIRAPTLTENIRELLAFLSRLGGEKKLQFLTAAELNCDVYFTIYVVGFMYFWQSNHIFIVMRKSCLPGKLKGCLLCPSPAAARLMRSRGWGCEVRATQSLTSAWFWVTLLCTLAFGSLRSATSSLPVPGAGAWNGPRPE